MVKHLLKKYWWAVVLVLILAYVFWPRTTTPVQTFKDTDVGGYDTDGRLFRGSANATVAVTEFGDFECPYCGQFFKVIEPTILKDYILTGKIRFYYKQFPLTNIHQYSLGAALASECAKEQGYFWAYHDTLFSSQVLNVASLKRYAAQLGLDTAKFNTCLDSGAKLDVIQADQFEGQQRGVTGTPTTFINTQKIGGFAPNPATYTVAIDRELNLAG